MTDIQQTAREIADSIITDARNSGDDPIAWVTGNSYCPPLRSFPGAEKVWQTYYNGGMFDPWGALVEMVESLLDAASVALECPEYDNALYAVDLARFEYVEDPNGETLQDDYRPLVTVEGVAYSTLASGDAICPECGAARGSARIADHMASEHGIGV